MKKSVAAVTQREADWSEREYQVRAKAALDRLYDEVEVQWCPFRGVGPGQYAPRVDLAVGPFAIHEQFGERYSELLSSSRSFVELLIRRHNENIDGNCGPASFDTLLHFNYNARCLLCIEIEESGSRKHCLGNLVNASALGRIGLLIARNDTILRIFLRQRVYLDFLAQAQKNTFKTDNALILTTRQFDECLASLT